MEFDKMFISIDKDSSSTLIERREIYNLDEVVKKIGVSLKKLDDFRASKMTNSKELLYYFIKNEIEIFIILNSRNSSEFEKVQQVKEDNENYEIVEKYLVKHMEEYSKEFKKIFSNAIFKDAFKLLVEKMEPEFFREFDNIDDILSFLDELGIEHKLISGLNFYLSKYV